MALTQLSFSDFKMPQYKVMYFDIKALAEPIRFLFHYGGIEFEDYRYSGDEWKNELKPSKLSVTLTS